MLEKWRRVSGSGRPNAQDWLSQFRQMHSEGLLSDQEFRTIKTTLIPQIQQEIDFQKNHNVRHSHQEVPRPPNEDPCGG